MTMSWANCVFCFLLTVMIVNVQIAAIYFLNKPKLDALQCHQQIAKHLIFNCYLVEEEQAKKHPRQGSIKHSLIMVPMNKRFIQGQLVTLKMKYGKWKCMSCSKSVCPPATALQDLCFVLTLAITELRLLWHNLWTHNLVLHHCNISANLSPLE